MSDQLTRSLQRLRFFGGTDPHPHTSAYAAAMESGSTLWKVTEAEDGLKLLVRQRWTRRSEPMFLVRIEPRKWSDAVFVPQDLRDPIVGFLHLVSHSKNGDQQAFAREHAYEIFWALRLRLFDDLHTLFLSVVDWHTRHDNLFNEEMCKEIYDTPRLQFELRPWEDLISKRAIIERMQLPHLFDGDGAPL